jgi:hypothetical protein
MMIMIDSYVIHWRIDWDGKMIMNGGWAVKDLEGGNRCIFKSTNLEIAWRERHKKPLPARTTFKSGISRVHA